MQWYVPLVRTAEKQTNRNRRPRHQLSRELSLKSLEAVNPQEQLKRRPSPRLLVRSLKLPKVAVLQEQLGVL